MPVNHEQSEIEVGTVFFLAREVRHIPALLEVEANGYQSWVDGDRYESWLRVANADAEEVEHEFSRLGWLFSSTETVIAAEAFGCDIGVLSRALSRAMQKAADMDLTAIEIIGIEVSHDSGVDYILAVRVRKLEKKEGLKSVGGEDISASREFEDQSVAV